MQLSERVAKIISDKSLTRTQLGELLGVGRTVVHKYLTGGAEPGPIPSLLLSALSSTEGERVFWVRHSGLTQAQFDLLAMALGITSPSPIDGSEVYLLEWWRAKYDNPMDEGIHAVVEKAIVAWRARQKQ